MKSDTPPLNECPQCQQVVGRLIDDHGRPWWACENEECTLYQHPYFAQTLICTRCDSEFYVDQYEANRLTKGRPVFCPNCNRSGTLSEFVTDYLRIKKNPADYPRPHLWNKIQQLIGPDSATSAKLSLEEIAEQLELVAQEHPDVKAAPNIDGDPKHFLNTAYALDLEDVVYLLERWHKRVEPDQIAYIANAVGEAGLFRPYGEPLLKKLIDQFYTSRGVTEDFGIESRILPDLDTHLFDDSRAARAVILACFYVYHYDSMSERLNAGFHWRDTVRELTRKGENAYPVRYLFFSWDLQWVPFVDKRNVESLHGWVQSLGATIARNYIPGIPPPLGPVPKEDEPADEPVSSESLPELHGRTLRWVGRTYELTPNQTKVMAVYVKQYKQDPDSALRGPDQCKRVGIYQTQLRKVFDDGSRPAWEVFEQTKRGWYRLKKPSPQ